MSEDLLTYLGLLAGEDPRRGQFFDVRWVAPTYGMRRRFVSATQPRDAAQLIARLASETDVYVGVALRDGNAHGGKAAISGSHLLYVDCDHSDALRSLASFEHPPTLEVATGTPDHLHAYWRLHSGAPNHQVESANRRLALALGGDPACVDIARILRPPDSRNHRHQPPRPVTLIAHRPNARYALGDLTRELPSDPRRVHETSAPRRLARTALERELLAIAAAEYVRVLVNATPDRSGKLLCPFHDDTQPSMQLYPDGTFYCFGSGCRRGGTIIDFAAATWGLGTRERDFLEVRRRLASAFGLPARSDAGH